MVLEGSIVAGNWFCNWKERNGHQEHSPKTKSATISTKGVGEHTIVNLSIFMVYLVLIVILYYIWTSLFWSMIFRAQKLENEENVHSQGLWRWSPLP